MSSKKSLKNGLDYQLFKGSEFCFFFQLRRVWKVDFIVILRCCQQFYRIPGWPALPSFANFHSPSSHITPSTPGIVGLNCCVFVACRSCHLEQSSSPKTLKEVKTSSLVRLPLACTWSVDLGTDQGFSAENRPDAQGVRSEACRKKRASALTPCASGQK